MKITIYELLGLIKEDKAKKYCKDLNKNMLYKANNIKFSLEEVVR